MEEVEKVGVVEVVEVARMHAGVRSRARLHAGVPEVHDDIIAV